MMTKEQYEKFVERMSKEPCGLPRFEGQTIQDCSPPSLDNYRCAICTKILWN